LDQVAFSNNQLVVKFKKEAMENLEYSPLNKSLSLESLNAINAYFGLHTAKPIGNGSSTRTFELTFSKDVNLDQLIKVYSDTDQFEYLEPNFIGYAAGRMAVSDVMPNDIHFNRQYGLFNDGSFSLSPSKEDADIDMELAWEIEQGDPSITVAVLDSGLKMDHPEFDSRLWENPGELIDGQDNDMNAYSDDINGWDFANDDNDPSDDHGHGTNVAGILAATGNNDIGYAGVDWNCKIMTCKIINEDNFGFYTWWADAIYYAVDNGAKVLNMSVGGSSYSRFLEDAVNYAYENGVTIVASMMNENNDLPYYPAAFLNTIAVGSTDANDFRSSPFFWNNSSGSCYGEHINVVAPGNYIYGLSYQSNVNYSSYWGGTSQAAPLVAGLASLLLAQNPSRSPDEIRSIIINSAEDQVGESFEDVAGFDIYYGYGRINAYEALLSDISSTTELSPITDISIYPNPIRDFVNIECEAGMKDLYIRDIRGTLVHVSDDLKGTKELELNLMYLPPGKYMIQIVSPQGLHFNSMLVMMP
jgi:subtilisin family serine protease